MNLNNDLVTEILLHLPVQSVLKFRIVCKSWCNIIDSSTFGESHYNKRWKNNDDEDTLILQFSNIDWNTWELSTLNASDGKSHKGFPTFHEFTSGNIQSYGLSIVGPVNGLICMHYTIPFNEDERRASLAIYNPCIDKIKTLHVSPFCSSLDCDDWNKAYCRREIGFGFDYATKDYKLVQLVLFVEGHRPTHVEVYSRTTNTWRELIIDSTLDSELFVYNIQGIQSSTYTKGGSMAHWRAQRRTMLIHYIEYVILSFNMQNEVFETIPFPNFVDGSVDVASSEVFAKDDDSFALFVYSCDSSRLEVWELERNKRCWTHVRDIVNVVSTTPDLGPKILWKREGIVLTECDPEGHNYLIFYATMKVTKSYAIPILPIQMLEYKGSLISP